MIYQTQHHYTFNPPLLKIHYVFPAYESSIIMIALKRIGNDQLLHFDKNDFGNFVDTLCQISDKEVIFLRVELNQIWHVNFYQRILTKYYYKFTIDTSCQCYIDYFCDTQLLCVREHGDNQDKTLRLTYFTMPLVPVQPPFQLNQTIQNENQQQGNMNPNYPPDFYIKPKATLIQQNLWNPIHSIWKVDAQSRYIWSQPRHSHSVKLHQAELIDEKVVVNILTISLSPLCETYNMDYMTLSIIDLWSFRPGELMLHTATNKSRFRRRETNFQGQISAQAQQPINNCFIWNIEKKTIRESLFTFDPKYQEFLIDVVGTPTLSMFRTFYYSNQSIMKSPAYFIDNSIERIIGQEKWKCSHRQKYSISDYLKDSISEAIYENEKVQNLTIRMIKKISRAELSLFLLINLKAECGKKGNVQDWDEDLLSDVLNSIDYANMND